MDGSITHVKGGSLDVICTKGLEYGDVSVEDAQLSDHYLLSGMFGLKGKSHNPQSTDCHPHASPRSYEFRDYLSL